MAKHKSKRQKASTTEAVVSNSTQVDSSAFDENALAALTKSIEKGFTESGSRSQKQGIAPVSSRDNNRQPAAKTRTKRDANGNFKVVESSKDRSNGDGTTRDVLLREILSLGGTEEDLDLVGDVDSEDDLEQKNISDSLDDSSLARDISKFVKDLGIDGQDLELEDDAIQTAGASGSDTEHSESDDELEDEPTAPSSAMHAEPVLQSQSSNSSTKNVTRLIFEARPDWHAIPLPELPAPEYSELASHRETISELRKYAYKLLQDDSDLYASKHMSSTSSHRFLSTIMSSGTLADKVSALTLVVQESPVHTTKSFENLLALAKKRSRGQAVSALGALKDLLGAGLVLPAERRLRSFEAQPGLLGTLQNGASHTWRNTDPLPGAISKLHLIYWAYEEWLKNSYFEMLKVLEGWCNDEVDFARQRAVTYVFELLRDKPEQETNLLRLLVNKLGDPDKKIASRTSYLILQLQTTHPLMKPIIVKAIESELLLKPNQGTHARYYAINTLNQTILSVKEEAVAQNLLGIYFDLFVSLLKKPDLDKLRAGPVINKKGQLQGGGGAKGKKAQAKADKELLAKLASEETNEKMISAVLTGVNRAFPFAGSNDASLDTHMDTLFRITHSSNFNTSIQALMLIQQLATTRNIAVDRFYRTLYESLLDHRLVTSSKHALYLNLLFRSLKADVNIKRVKAFVKRLLQILTLHQPPFVCGVLYLIRELEVTIPGLSSLLKDPEELDDADEEVFRDVPDEDEPVNRAPSSTMHEDRVLSRQRLHAYDGRKRDPEHSNADKSCLWELMPFLSHFHPSVSLFADRLVDGSEMPSKPDLASHTLIHFLDRFVYRNAKTSAGGLRGSSIMQPLAGGDSRGILVSNGASNRTSSVNTEAFWRKDAEDVAVDEVFFHRYFSHVGKNKSHSRKDKKVTETSNGVSDSEDDNEHEIWQALVESRPDVEGPSDTDDDDLELSDFDDTDGSVDAEEEPADLDDHDVSAEQPDEHTLAGDSRQLQDQMSDDFDEPAIVFSEDEDDLVSENEMFARELQKAQPPEDHSTGKESSRSRRKKMKALPTFASIEDYADMLGEDEEGA